MKIAGPLALALALAILADPVAVDPRDHETGPQVAVTCSKLKEHYTGKRRICYYDCMGTTRAISIPAIQQCPSSIDR